MNLTKITLKKKDTPIPRAPLMGNDFGVLDLAELALKVGGATTVGGPAGGALALALDIAGKPGTRNIIGCLKDVVSVATSVSELASVASQALSLGGVKSNTDSIKIDVSKVAAELKRMADEAKPMREAIENFSKRWSVVVTVDDRRAREEKIEVTISGRQAGSKVQYGFRLGTLRWVEGGVPVGPEERIMFTRQRFVCPYPNVDSYVLVIPPGVKVSATLAEWSPPKPPKK
jgi:hypothetical protein